MKAIDLLDDQESILVGNAHIEILIRRIPSDVYAEIRRRHTSEVAEAGGGRRQVVDEESVDRDCLDHAVLAFRKGVRYQGRPAECTPAAKAKLPAPIRRQLLGLAFGALNLEGELEGELRNLPPASAPDTPEAGSTSGR